MLQRVQTVFLLASLMLTGTLLFVPFAEIVGADGNLYLFDIKGVHLLGANAEIIFNGWPVLFLDVICVVLFIVTIFMYKKRVLQMRISTINIFLNLGLSGVIYYFTWHGASILEGPFSLRTGFILPIISAILIYLAIRAIAKDEALVRSIDRIR
jgi:hypothetical protein